MPQARILITWAPMLARMLLLATVAAACNSDTGDTRASPDASVACPTQPASGAACAEEAQTCPVEGTGTCDQPPAGGTCTCTNGSWACASGCADGCPDQAPAQGAACTLTTGTECRYEYPHFTRCTCMDGAFHCY